MRSALSTLASLGAWSLLTTPQSAQAESTTCDGLSTSSNIDIFRSPAVEYTRVSNDYWSTGCAALKPACILEPTSAGQLSHIMQTLVANNESFAVKSGGHNPNKYFASISGGPLISTSQLNEVVYDAASSTVRVGPGNKWDDVHKVLDPLGVTVVGGRIGNVGVGGYVLGAGLSFLSTQYGWAANNLVAAEMVLPNGTIITASNSSNPAIFQGLKGGGSNFGIVTTYVLKTYPIGQIWGGNLVFLGAQKTDGILSAVRNFTENYDDPKAAIIATSELTLGKSTDLWILFLFYDGLEPPAGIFDEFLALKPDINSCKTRSYSDLLTSNNAFVLKGSVYTIGTETTPLPPADRPDIMRSYYDHWHNTSATRSGVFGLISSLALQPLPKSLATIARQNGGDLLDFDDDVDRLIFELDYSYVFEDLDSDKVDGAMVEAYSGLGSLVSDYVADGSLPDVYLPLFMNDCYFRQDYWGRLKTERRELAKNAQAQADPAGVMKTLSQGFHL
ncbi:hypothetical protein KVR01_005286 [Diaporthe batatas]|uniref:uncharacterized protein n=1 Tax=Diaporthe batatas TaxID=748121 RepID=UPI001D0442ED|nr:uncharacterized protein KVR01_005286 [Diaporthe batatas]KAG8165011.1 hypothetical protein KVR01_005286 [Diaporthe batatas]